MDTIAKLHAQKSLRDIDYTLTMILAETYGERNADAMLAAALTSNADASGHTCLDLESIAGKPWPQPEPTTETRTERTSITLPDIDPWLNAIGESPLWDMAGEQDTSSRPFIVSGTLAYLRRFYRYEQQVAQQLLHLAEATCGHITDAERQTINALFPDNTIHDCGGSGSVPTVCKSLEDQRKAAEIAITKRLLLLTGGPGTGKTFAVARLLHLILKQAGPRKLEIKLAAPTGKAAMRMRESLRDAMNQSFTPETLDDTATLHRLLGTIPNSPQLRHHAQNPLTADVLIIDEASMIALPMMAKVLDALKPGARLILLGDKNQLSSVEPGYVFGDICNAARESQSPLHGTLVELRHSHRFPSNGPVGQLSAALQIAGTESDPEGAETWQLAINLAAIAGINPTGLDHQQATLTLHQAVKALLPFLKNPRDYNPRAATENANTPTPSIAQQAAATLQQAIGNGYAGFLNATSVTAAFKALADFRILCALRSGPYGVENLNKLAEHVLSLNPAGTSTATRLKPTGAFYDHRIVMVTRNTYGMNLFNGDIGIILPVDADQPKQEAANSKNLVCWFENNITEDPLKKYRPVACNRLPEHETAFAMTIHKSQGSQFTTVLMLLPPEDIPVLTKELIYTGITRVVQNIDLWCQESIFKQAVTRPTTRASGLEQRLHAPLSAAAALPKFRVSHFSV